MLIEQSVKAHLMHKNSCAESKDKKTKKPLLYFSFQH